MGNRKFLFASFLLLSSGIWAKEITDTLESTKGDRVIVTYDMTQNNGQVVIKFIDVKKRLGRIFKDKYKKLDEVVVLFFDRTGNFEDKMVFSGIDTEAFMIPASVSYRISRDGYFLLNDNPTLSIELKSAESEELKIPIFIAHYEGKHRYEIFSRCENLVVKLFKRKQTTNTGSTSTQVTTQTITSQEEVDGALSETDEAKILIKIIYDLLDEQDGDEFTDELQQSISKLRVIGHSTSDRSLSSRISDVLADCKQKEKELKASANAAAGAAAKEAELQAKKAEEEEAQARQDSIAAAAQQKVEKDRKQNLLLIIGGVVLAVFGFVGNQVFQYFRNVKNQKSIMDMQQNVVKRAEDEAKRRARNMAQGQINRVQSGARQKTQNAINNGIGKIGKRGKGNKGISI